MRIIAGRLRGRRLESPRGRGVRPTSDRIRESMFDLLGPGIEGLRVLDLFAGSGALGIEALSRGAGQALFVERDRQALALLRRNLAACRLEGDARVVAGEVRAFLAADRPGSPFDLVLADPPYRRGWPAVIVELLARGGWLGPGGRLVLEAESGAEVPGQEGPLALEKSRRYGNTAVHVYRVVGDGG